MAAVFPLTYTIWAAWLEDEKRLAASDEERQGVLALYGRAVGDYLCIPLWLDYCEYSEEVAGPGDEAAVREVFEEAIQAGGNAAAGHHTLGPFVFVCVCAFVCATTPC